MEQTKLIVFAGFDKNDTYLFTDTSTRELIFDTFRWLFFEKNCKIIILNHVVEKIMADLKAKNIKLLSSSVSSFFQKMERIDTPISKNHTYFEYEQQNKNAYCVEFSGSSAVINFIEYYLPNIPNFYKFLFWEHNTKLARKLIIIDEEAFLRESIYLPILVKIDIVGNESDLRNWLKKNRQPRVFEYCDKHHRAEFARQEKGQWISPLLYNESEEKEKITNNLLQKAIQIKDSTLAVWDEEKGCYLIFKYNSKELNDVNSFTFHGFHITGGKNKKPNENGGKESMTREQLTDEERAFIDKKFKP